ncbi:MULTISPECIES: TonB-dependent receptor [unclassified Sphingomonas]|uniref:TonB-dependent receptor n=1 Tax=unclassified Sphingomonas TaxID=196159 RepID=UPI000310D028|nr:MULTISPECIES: TonB-dependent receptor [unclassified Sphingomonas]KTF67811.1 TonB-dependent receptor [Sphingomonas sp. WG]
MVSKLLFLTSVSVASMVAGGQAQAQAESSVSVAAPQESGVADATAQDQVNDEIVVTGVRASIVGAINRRRESVQIVDSVVAEDVGKLPDNNVIEALQRVTGVQVTDRGQAEAGGIQIRGLPDALTTLNGRNIFTAAGQSFALQDVSANLIKRVDVYKTRAADQIETGLAGQVDVVTRRPFDFKGFAVSGLVRGIYDQEADKFNPNVALLLSDRWQTGIGEVGLLVNGSYTRQKFRTMSTTAGAFVPFATLTPPAGTGLTGFQRIFPAPRNPTTGQFINTPGLGNWEVGTETGLSTAPGATINVNGVATPYWLARDAVFSSDLYGKRERPSANAALQWSPNSSSVYTAEVFYAGFRGETYNSLQFSFVDFWANPQAPTLYEGTNIVKSRVANDVYGFNSGDYNRSQTDSFVYALNGKWDLGSRGGIVADLAYQTSRNKTAFFAMRTDRVASRITTDFNAGGGIPSYHFDNDALLTDARVWNVGELYDNENRDKGSAFTAMLDGHYGWDEGFLRQIKAGFRYDARRASSDLRTADAAALRRPLASLPAGSTFTNSDFFKGRADVPTSWVNVNGYYIYDNADEIRRLYGLKTSDQLTLTRVFDVDEKTTAAYVQADGQLMIFGRPLNLQGGVRFVAVDTDAVFVDRFRNNAVSRASPGSDRFLPSFTARYEITPNLRARFNYGETLRRPGFGSINPNFSLTGDLTGVGFGTGSAGTANLQPTTSKNYDVALEWYFGRNSALTVTGFRRDIEGLVVPISQLEIIPNNGIVAGATNNFVISRPANASNGVLKGLEVGLTYFPTYFPSVLNGLGFQGSLTLLDSSQNVPIYNNAGQQTGEQQSSFFGVSDLSYNATLAYDNGPIGARLSYVYRNAWQVRNEARLFANPLGVWRRAEATLDFQLTARITDRLGLTFDAVNLTRTKQQEYYRFGEVGDQDRFNLGTVLIPRTFAIGARYSFN